MTNVAEKLTTIADNIPKVYDAGKRVGAETNEAFEEGKKAARLDWWAKYINLQPNGIGYVYSGNNMFSGPGWSDDTFDLPYTIQELKRVDEMFKASGRIDLKSILERNGVSIKFDKCTNFQNMFYYSGVYNIPEIDCSLATSMRCMFDNARGLRNIDKIILPKEEPYNGAYEYMFNQCESLETVTFERNITQSVSFQWSTKLSKASIESIATALSKSGSGKTITFSQTAVNNIPNSTWSNIYNNIIEKGWSISLA